MCTPAVTTLTARAAGQRQHARSAWFLDDLPNQPATRNYVDHLRRARRRRVRARGHAGGRRPDAHQRGGRVLQRRQRDRRHAAHDPQSRRASTPAAAPTTPCRRDRAGDHHRQGRLRRPGGRRRTVDPAGRRLTRTRSRCATPAPRRRTTSRSPTRPMRYGCVNIAPVAERERGRDRRRRQRRHARLDDPRADRAEHHRHAAVHRRPRALGRAERRRHRGQHGRRGAVLGRPRGGSRTPSRVATTASTPTWSADTVTLNVDLPALTVVKTTGGRRLPGERRRPDRRAVRVAGHDHQRLDHRHRRVGRRGGCAAVGLGLRRRQRELLAGRRRRARDQRRRPHLGGRRRPRRPARRSSSPSPRPAAASGPSRARTSTRWRRQASTPPVRPAPTTAPTPTTTSPRRCSSCPS